MTQSLTDYQRRLKQRLEYEQYIIKRGFTHFVTFNFNFHENTNIEGAIKTLRKFCMKINRKLHGQNFNKKMASEKTQVIAFLEHIDSNLHFHAAVTTADCEGFNKYAPKIWEKLVSSGSIHIEYKNFTDGDIKEIASYIYSLNKKQGRQTMQFAKYWVFLF